MRKELHPTAENVSDFKESAVFLENCTTKIVVFRGVFRKDGIRYETIVSYSIFRFVFHGFE